jgi:hypothetical protein
MKIILSRKGFDGATGGVPSPILSGADDTLFQISLPIPLEGRSTCSFEDITRAGLNLRELAEHLICGPRRNARAAHLHELDYGAHLDPDLLAGDLQRRDDWRPAFGQNGGPERYLANHDVGGIDGGRLGDRPLFLFFGLYRRAVHDHRWLFERQAPRVHAVFGWLQVERKLLLTPEIREAGAGDWLGQHAHVANPYYDLHQPNALYAAPRPGGSTDNLWLGDRQVGGVPAAGVFSRYCPGIHDLTAAGAPASRWRLPACFRSAQGMILPLRAGRWRDDGDALAVDTHFRWQELVFESGDAADEGALFEWIEAIVRSGAGGACRAATGQL